MSDVVRDAATVFGAAALLFVFGWGAGGMARFIRDALRAPIQEEHHDD